MGTTYVQATVTGKAILGEKGAEPLLGAVTLEILGLMLNPFRRTLEPMRMMLASATIRRGSSL